MLDHLILKLESIALDLREMSDGSDPAHQAEKIERVAQELSELRDLIVSPGASTQVHGSGTGKD